VSSADPVWISLNDDAVRALDRVAVTTLDRVRAKGWRASSGRWRVRLAADVHLRLKAAADHFGLRSYSTTILKLAAMQLELPS
jgi:hypothetical protein